MISPIYAKKLPNYIKNYNFNTLFYIPLLPNQFL